ncbi:MAG: glycosyl hydrolase [Planctomycetes bacterium]|nr:glycosyl hydrolase [Planctomycetota bacterium]
MLNRNATWKNATLAIAIAAGMIAPNVYAQDSDERKDEMPGINSGLVSPLRFRGIGPAFMSGRIGDIAVDPVNRSTWYIAASSGGVWKTTNAGVTFSPIFDGYTSFSIGCVTVSPHDRHTVWVGTGENNSQRSVAYGDGVYKSTDGGQSFAKVGLENSEHIGMIAVHPTEPNTVFVAAQGPLWKDGGDRGLYRTTDGGRSWSKVLDISPMTGVNEIHIDHENPDVMYATSYQRRRHEWVLIDGGPESAIYKSTDGGNTWRKANRGLPGGDLGRIGLDISPVNSEVVFAIVEAGEGKGGFYRSKNRGETWERVGSYVSSGPQYYNEIVCCPHNIDRIYSLDTNLMVSEDGGKTFVPAGEDDKHVDNHAIVIDPVDPNHLIVGCDGGIYETWDRCKTYDYKANLPITQFYRVAVSNEKPFYYVYGGTQDNATQGGPSRTNNDHGIRNSDWFVTVFGDGFEPAVDPQDPDTVYSQWQYGGLVRYNRKTGERVDIKPQESKDGPPLRWNWDSPLLISPHNPKRLYYASQILFRSEDRGDNWTAISPDLSRQIDRNQLKVMGRVWSVDAVAKNTSTSLYGNIVSLDESPRVAGLLYVGTDEGLVQISEDGGGSWRKVDQFGTLDVPEFGYINDIEADLHDDNTVYVAVQNHKRGDFKPYILKSNDRGRTWSDITGNLPVRGSVYTLKQDHVNPKLLFCGTEFGVFFTIDGGEKWVAIKSGLPTISIRDMEIQRRESDLVLATFGRGFYILDDYSPLRDLKPELLETNHMFPIKKGLMFQTVTPMGVSDRGFQGANFYTAPNPDYGVTFTFYLKEELKSKKSEREKKDRERSSGGRDAPYPSWEDLKAEDREVGPSRWLTIRDAAGNVIRKIPTSTDKGMVRTTWDFRHAGGGGGGRRRSAGAGPIAVPGKYTIEISQMVEGNVTEVLPKVEFEIEPLTFGDTTEINRQAILDFSKQVLKLANAVSAATQQASEASEHLSAIEALTKSAAEVDAALWKEIRALQVRLLNVQEKFSGDPTRTRRNEDAMPGLQSRLANSMMGAMGSTSGPTGTHRRQYEIAGEEFDAAMVELNQLLGTDIPALLKKLDDVGAPWTPGRAIPKWK